MINEQGADTALRGNGRRSGTPAELPGAAQMPEDDPPSDPPEEGMAAPEGRTAGEGIRSPGAAGRIREERKKGMQE